MTQQILITLDQLRRPSPAGIGTYIRGLLSGLSELVSSRELDAQIVALAPRGPALNVGSEFVSVRTMSVGEKWTTLTWPRAAIGVPRDSEVVHATSMAGPFRGGAPGAVHSVLVHDLLWREYPELTTRRGVSYHEARLQQIIRDDQIRALVTSAPMKEKLASSGVDRDRIYVIHLGIEHPTKRDQSTLSNGDARLNALLGDVDNFTLAVGTIQPRKNLERLIAAHAQARRTASDLGPLLIVGARGWGDVNTDGARELGELDDDTLGALVARARVVAYVPIEEGWGLPAVEALAIGRPVVASTTVPSVVDNNEAIRVSAVSIEEIRDGLIRAANAPDDQSAQQRRRDSVQHLNWASCAREHVAAWS